MQNYKKLHIAQKITFLYVVYVVWICNPDNPTDMNLRIYNPHLHNIQMICFYMRITNANIQAFRIVAIGNELKVANPKEQKDMNLRIYNPHLHNIQMIRFYMRITNANIQAFRILNPKEQKRHKKKSRMHAYGSNIKITIYYQIFAHSDSGMYIASPSLIPNALWKSSIPISCPFTLHLPSE